LTEEFHPCTIISATIPVEIRACFIADTFRSYGAVVNNKFGGVFMKKGIHPNYIEATVSCACGNSFQTLSIKPLLKIDVCSNCHPFFTGQQRILDTAGRVERFRKRFNLQEEE